MTAPRDRGSRAPSRPLRPSEVYLRAAERIAAGSKTNAGCLDSCCMITECGSVLDRYAYQELFAPMPRYSPGYFGVWGKEWDKPRQCRILALLFMHHIAKDDE